MKKIFIFAAAAAMFASCAQDELLTEVEPSNVEQAIGFGTFASKTTRGTTTSENNGTSDVPTGLEKYYKTFKVWGYKNIKQSGEPATYKASDVFNSNVGNTLAASSLVSYEETPVSPFTTNWSYEPIRYWDKSAKDYDFHAAAPSTVNWAFALESATDNQGDANKRGYFTLESQTIKGESLPLNTAVTGQPYDNFTKGTNKDNDLMIANDVVSTSFTTDPIEFDFNHILSRLNIGVKIGNAIKVTYKQNDRTALYNDVETQLWVGSDGNWYVEAGTPGTYQQVTESAGVATDAKDAEGNAIAPKTASEELTFTKLTEDDKTQPLKGVVLLKSIKVHNLYNSGSFDEEKELLEGETLATGTYSRWDISSATNTEVFAQFPNNEVVGTEDGDADVTLNLSKVFTATLPGSEEATEVKVDDFKYVYQGLLIPQPAAVETVNLDGSNSAGLVQPWLEINYSIDGDDFHYYYNLATIFTTPKSADATTPEAIKFNEGWQNNLQIVINPAFIQFVAHVFPWATNENNEFIVE